VSAAAQRQQTHRRPTTRRSPAPRSPRRVSGPARPAGGRDRVLHANAGAIALPRPRPVGRPVDGLAPRVLDGLKALPDHPFLDRLLRGRGWIALVAIALGGIVAMQVSMLKINAGIGRAVEHSSTLERQNAELRATVSQLSSEERIQREAIAMGLKMPGAGDVRYLTARGAEDGQKAARVMRKPDPTPSQQAAAAAAAAATPAVVAPVAAATAPDPAATTAAPAEPVTPVEPAAPAEPVQQTPAPTPQPQAQAQAQAAPAGAAVAPATGGTP
jgi:hypothetical protein